MRAATGWWREAIVYQVYPRSFCDSNDDGIGDLPGLIGKLDYLQSLGVDTVWLSPVYRSPNHDNGYDVSDYQDIHPEFGTLDDIDRLLAGLGARGMRLVMDLVVNHTSDEHPWFVEACRSRDNPYRDFYVWRSSPNNWESAFGGSAWEWHAPTGEYYLHLFSSRQPELNWENPRVRRAVWDLMHFWLRRGVAGFRMDVINLISKPPGLPDAPVVRPGPLQPAFGLVANGPRLGEYLAEMKCHVLDHYDCMTVGETPLATTAHALALTHDTRGTLNMVFQFEHMELDNRPGESKWALQALDLPGFKRTIARWQTGLDEGGWNSIYLGNHDQPRPVSRFGDDGVHRVAAAKMLATFQLGLKGTPFIYQGEELGMTNARFPGIGDYRDIETLNYYREAVDGRGEDPATVLAAIHAKGRDNARTPMQWDEGPHAGFSGHTPWIALNPNHATLHAAGAIADPDSVFHHYRRLIALRRATPALVHGRFALIEDTPPAVFAYTRTLDRARFLVACNFSGETVRHGIAALDGATVVLGNLEGALPGQLRPWEARLVRN